MHHHVQTWRFESPKAGETPANSEDRSVIYQRHAASPIAIAISNGATASFRSGRWAELLVQRYIADPPEAIDQDWLLPVAELYRKDFELQSLRWNIQEKAGRGGFATLLGIELDVLRRRLFCLSVGDSCLYIRTQSSIRVFPSRYEASASFLQNPYLIASNPSYNQELSARAKTESYRIPRGQSVLYAVSDCLGRWMSLALERGGTPWHILDEVSRLGTRAFKEFVRSERASGDMEDDDVTLIIVRVVVV